MPTRWEERLVELRAALLDGLPLEADGSAAPEALARRAVIRESLPGSVTYFAAAGIRVLRIELGGTFEFGRPRLSAAAKEFLDEVQRDRVSSMTPPGGDVVWLAVDESGSPIHPLPFALDHAIALRLDDEVERRRIVLAMTFDAIGWRAVATPTPDGSPDPRIGAVARMRRLDGPQPIGAADLVRDTQDMRSLTVVPPEIEAVVQTARLLYVRGWHQWEFFTLAQREATFALEAALRLLDADEHGRTSRRPFAALIDGLGRSEDSALLSDWERREAHDLRQTRNAMTHPTGGQMIEWISWARQGIDRSIRLINLTWARHRASVPLELGWERHREP